MAQSLTDFVANLKRITELDVNNGNDPSDDMFSIMASSISDFVAEGDQSDEILDIIENNKEEVINIIEGINSEVDDLRSETNTAIDDILAMRDLVDGEFKPQLNLEILSRKESDRALFDTTASLAEFRRKTSEFENDITDAVFEVNPEDGTINLRAYSYTDEAFSQAGILIDGVNAEVSIQAGRITDLGNSVEDANSEINVLAGQIELKSSYTEMTEYVSGALDAVIPAYSFGFFNSTEGWSAVNGDIYQGNSKITTSWGDIENQDLSYSADDNPVITLSITRTEGTGYTGDLIVFFDDNSAETYLGVISDTPLDTTNVKVLNLGGEDSYTGTVTGVRLVLGESVSDEFEIESITIGKPSAQLEALDGITAQVNQLGIDIDAVEGQLTSFVTTTFYDENSVTLNNVSQVLDGEDAIISLKATQNVLNEQGTIDKANTASFWVDAADANVTTTLTSFNAQEGGIDDQLSGLAGSVNTINQELSTIDGASIRTQLLSINNLEIESGNLEEAQFYTELKLLDQKSRNLTLGDSIATIDTQTKTLATDSQALAQQITELSASIGTIEGQVDANATFILNTDAKADGTAQSLAALETEVTNTKGEVSDAQLLLDSTVDDLGEVSSRAFLGVSGTVDGKTTVTGITADSATNGLRFQGDVIQFDDTDGTPALKYRADLNKWVFTGNVVVGGYTVESEDDIRALDGNTIYEKYQYSVDGSTDWHDDYVTGDIYRRTATVTNGVQGAWRDLSRITGFTPEIVNNPDGSYTITNGTESATIFDGVDGQDAPIPTAVDNGDGTYTITDGEGNSVTVSNGENGETPVKGIDYFDGRDGSFVSNIYRTSSTGLPPLPVGGTFDGVTEVIPDNYQDSPYFEDGKITYISTTRYSQQSDGSWVKSEWSTPTEYIIKGDEGPQGVAGIDGVDGVTTYTWIRYADSVTGGGISNSPTNKAYIGFAYNKTTPVESNTPTDYTWSLIKGENGTDGVKGDTGEDGTTYYTWIAYSDFADGTDLYQTPNDNTLYIGIAPNKLTPTESSIKGDYTWSRFKGEQGSDGVDGKDAISNLIDPSDEWKIGTSGSQGGYIQSGATIYNKVLNVEGAFGLVEPVWQCGGQQSAEAGGWDKTVVADSSKSYRFSVWAYRNGGADMRLYFGCQSALNTDLSTNGNPYFSSDVSLSVGSKWYLLVGMVHGNNGISATHTGKSGVYDPETGEMVQSFSEYVNAAGMDTLTHRVFRREANDTLPTKLARPRIDLLDGNEPSISDLLNKSPQDGKVGAGFYGSTYSSISWTTSTANSRFSELVGRPPVELDIFTQTRIDGTDSQARQYNGSSWVSVALQVNGSIVASGTIAGDRLIAGTEISAPKITGGEINGGEIIGSRITTSNSTASRTEIEDDGTYMIWTGSGSKTDSNATFFVKKDGTGFVSGSFFSGQIIETKFNQGSTSASVSHNSAGNDVELTIGSSGSATVIAGSAPSSTGASTYTLPYTVSRGSTTLETGNVIVTRVVEFEAAESEYTTRDYYNFSTTVVDTSTGSSTYTYTVTVGGMPLSTSSQKTNLRSYEDLLSS